MIHFASPAEFHAAVSEFWNAKQVYRFANNPVDIKKASQRMYDAAGEIARYPLDRWHGRIPTLDELEGGKR